MICAVLFTTLRLWLDLSNQIMSVHSKVIFYLIRVDKCIFFLRCHEPGPIYTRKGPEEKPYKGTPIPTLIVLAVRRKKYIYAPKIIFLADSCHQTGWQLHRYCRLKVYFTYCKGMRIKLKKKSISRTSNFLFNGTFRLFLKRCTSVPRKVNFRFKGLNEFTEEQVFDMFSQLHLGYSIYNYIKKYVFSWLVSF